LNEEYAVDSEGGTATLSFRATDVTGTQTLEASDVEYGLPAGVVASALVDGMSLPTNVAWALRDDTTTVYLDDTRPIGEQIAPDAQLTLTPRAHLG
jgi:hypothetical protein